MNILDEMRAKIKKLEKENKVILKKYNEYKKDVLDFNAENRKEIEYLKKEIQRLQNIAEEILREFEKSIKYQSKWKCVDEIYNQIFRDYANKI